MYLLKAISNEMEYEATFFYLKNALEIIDFFSHILQKHQNIALAHS
jgi:hypothetical protein